MQELVRLSLDLLQKQHFDSLAVGVLNFSKGTYESFEILQKNIVSPKPYAYFDLASLTKPLTLASTKLKHPELFDEKLNLLLNHKAGLPMGGRLPQKGWREELEKYAIEKSETLYSDYSALRLQIELEKKSGKTLKELCSYFWDKELCFWTELSQENYFPETGFRRGKTIQGEVHDPNCFNLHTFTSHAGLFGTIEGLCRSLIRLDKQTNLIDKMEKAFASRTGRFLEGWDTVEDPSKSLAGPKVGLKTFGHLGFTGTSIWIDSEKKRGSVILTNATQNYWYERNGLSELRRSLGESIFSLADQVLLC